MAATWTADRLIGLFDHSLLNPTFTDADLRQQLAMIRAYPVATVCIKPYAVPMAVEALRGTKIGICTVIGFPHGSALPEVKAFEAERAFKDGATEMDMVVNIGKVLSDDWAYVRDDIAAVLAVTRRHRGGLLKVIFETDFVTDDARKIKLCEICSELKVDFVKTSTGYGFVKRPDGSYAYTGATVHDLELMRKHCSPGMGIKPAGGVRTLDDTLRMVAAGATRIGATATAAIHKEALARFGK